MNNPYLEITKNIFDSMNIQIPDEELLNFSKLFNKRTFKKGEFFIQAGDNSYDFLFVTKGLLRSYYITFDGDEYIIAFRKEFDLMLAYYTVMTGRPSNFYVEALEDTEVLVADFREFEKFYDQHPIWNKVARIFYSENYISKSAREENLLLKDATNRYLQFVEDNPGLAERLTQKHIAQYLGISAISLNRIIKNLKK